MACGGAPETSPSSSAQTIVGGQLADATAWPNVVKLNNECTGIVVSADQLITAAHCGAPKSALTGADPDSHPDQTLAVDGCRVPTESAIGSGQDVMICHFTPALPNLPRVPIALGCERELIRTKTPVTLVGFGETSIEEQATGPKRVVEAAIEGLLLSHEFRIGSENAGSCYGDSGSPAFIRVDGSTTRPSWRLIGILSSGYTNQCGQGFYSDLTRLVPWLEQQARRDLSPCFDDEGSWSPTRDCSDPALDANGEPLDSIQPSTSCGAAYEAEPPDPTPTLKPSGGCNSSTRPSPGRANALFALLAVALALVRRRRRCPFGSGGRRTTKLLTAEVGMCRGERRLAL